VAPESSKSLGSSGHTTHAQSVACEADEMSAKNAFLTMFVPHSMVFLRDFFGSSVLLRAGNVLGKLDTGKQLL
jgi:hypothetical protein